MHNNYENIINTINKYSNMVYRLALTRCANKENCEDIFQEVFLKLTEKSPKFNSQEHEKAWLIQVTINLTKNYNNSSWNRKMVQLDENMPYDKEYEDSQNILDEVMNLSQEYRTVIYLFYYEGYRVNEISKLMKKSEGTIKTWLFRAREQLRNKLGGGFENE